MQHSAKLWMALQQQRPANPVFFQIQFHSAVQESSCWLHTVAQKPSSLLWPCSSNAPRLTSGQSPEHCIIIFHIVLVQQLIHLQPAAQHTHVSHMCLSCTHGHQCTPGCHMHTAAVTAAVLLVHGCAQPASICLPQAQGCCCCCCAWPLTSCTCFWSLMSMSLHVKLQQKSDPAAQD